MESQCILLFWLKSSKKCHLVKLFDNCALMDYFLGMTILDIIFQVEFGTASFRYYEKVFVRKYPKGWIETKKTIASTLKRAYAVQRTTLIDFLKPLGENVGLYKLYFAVAGTQMSPKASGNRVIFSLSNKDRIVTVLLIYGKDRLPKNMTETQWISQMVKDKYGL